MEKKIFSMFIVVFLVILGVVIVYTRHFKEQPVKEVDVKENLNYVDTNLVNFVEDNQIRRLLAIKKYPNNFIFSNAMFDNDFILWALDKSCLPLRECVNISSTTLDLEFEKVFNLQNIAYDDYKCKVDNLLLYKYNKENKTYTLANTLHSHDKSYNYVEPIHTKIDSIKKIGKDYILTLYELYYDLNNNSFISADPLGEVKILDPSNYINGSSEIDTTRIITDYENGFEGNKKNYPSYKYTFRKNGDEFYLYKFER